MSEDTNPSLPRVVLGREAQFQVNEDFECPIADFYRREFSEVVKSAKRGCPNCILHFEAVTRCMPDRPIQAVESRHNQPFYTLHLITECELDPFIHPKILFHLTGEDTTWEYTSCLFFGATVLPPQIQPLAPGNTASFASLQNILTWITECTGHHKSCNSNTAQPLPTRVLKLDGDNVVLYESKGESSSRYACLSHCWGSPQSNSNIFRTTKDTLSRFKEGIPWSQLPKTFRDAIIVTQRLGLRLLWIDSLCIVQDDELDWERECSKMAATFENCYITLAATQSIDPTGGCFSNIGQLPLRAQCLPFSHGYHPETSSKIYARVKSNHIHDEYGRHISSYPLLKRAWAHQERLLPSRVVHFAGYELTWECRERTACECGDTRTRGFHPKINHSQLILSHLQNSKRSMWWETTQSALESGWWSIVKDYMSRNITFSKDVFPALAGLARQWNLTHVDEYLAGMWRSSIHQDLLWRSGNDGEYSWRSRSLCMDVKASPRMSWRAPSWSWASIPSGTTILHDAHVERQYASVLAVNCTPSSIDWAGEISSAQLTISAQALTGYISHDAAEYTLSLSGTTCKIWGNHTPDYPFLPNDPVNPFEVTIILMSVGRVNLIWEYSTAFFLLLKQTSDDSSIYKRVGAFKITYYFSDTLPDALIISHEDQKLSFTDEERESQDINVKLFRAFWAAPRRNFTIL